MILHVPARPIGSDLTGSETFEMLRQWGLQEGNDTGFIGIWGFPKITGTILGTHIIRTIVFWGLFWDYLVLGNCHIAE